jgi:3-dehydroquinate dehydratase
VKKAIYVPNGPNLNRLGKRDREAIYHDSLISKVATGVIMGLGPDGYRAAVEAMARRLGAA